MKTLWLVGLFVVVGTAASTARAFEFRARFIERVGNENVILPGNTIDASNGLARRIRIQFGVFDDAAGAAPAGGFVGWNVGSLAVSGALANSAETRTPGRLSPFTFAPQQNANGNPPLASPGGDPFTMLTEIDNTLGTQTTLWRADQPLPDPAVVRGFNDFVSIFEFTIDPADTGGGAADYTITLGGNVIGASEWRMVGTPTAPGDDDGPPCDFPPACEDPPGSATWAPNPTPPQGISAVLNVVVVPSPPAAVVVGGMVLFGLRRRR